MLLKTITFRGEKLEINMDLDTFKFGAKSGFVYCFSGYSDIDSLLKAVSKKIDELQITDEASKRLNKLVEHVEKGCLVPSKDGGIHFDENNFKYLVLNFVENEKAKMQLKSL